MLPILSGRAWAIPATMLNPSPVRWPCCCASSSRRSALAIIRRVRSSDDDVTEIASIPARNVIIVPGSTTSHGKAKATLERRLGPRATAAQLQQRPAPAAVLGIAKAVKADPQIVTDTLKWAVPTAAAVIVLGVGLSRLRRRGSYAQQEIL